MPTVRTATACTTAALVCLCSAVPAQATTTTLANLLQGDTLQVDGLTFSNFKPWLSPNFPSGNAVLEALLNNPSALGGMPLVDPTGSGVLSRAFGNATPAVASAIMVESLVDDPVSAEDDPGLRFDGPTT